MFNTTNPVTWTDEFLDNQIKVLAAAYRRGDTYNDSNTRLALAALHRGMELAPLIAAAEHTQNTLKALASWFDTDEDILAAMPEAERIDNARQLAKARAAPPRPNRRHSGSKGRTAMSEVDWCIIMLISGL